MKHFYKYVIILFVTLFFIGIVNINNNKQSIQFPDPKTAGTDDNPFGASEYRYEMIKGKADFINPLARRRAIDLQKNI